MVSRVRSVDLITLTYIDVNDGLVSVGIVLETRS